MEHSLESGFVKGMKLEVPNRLDPDTYWVATVIMTCGPLLRLRYEGYKEDDPIAEFWCDRTTMDVHEIGWCAKNGKNLKPPEGKKHGMYHCSEVLCQDIVQITRLGLK